MLLRNCNELSKTRVGYTMLITITLSSELVKVCSDLGIQFLRIGRVLSVRWVASSFRTVSAVWFSFPGLCEHFLAASVDVDRDSKERQKFKGLLRRLSSREFLCDQDSCMTHYMSCPFCLWSYRSEL
jgi:hypothetical protein